MYELFKARDAEEYYFLADFGTRVASSSVLLKVSAPGLIAELKSAVQDGNKAKILQICQRVSRAVRS